MNKRSTLPGFNCGPLELFDDEIVEDIDPQPVPCPPPLRPNPDDSTIDEVDDLDGGMLAVLAITCGAGTNPVNRTSPHCDLIFDETNSNENMKKKKRNERMLEIVVSSNLPVEIFAEQETFDKRSDGVELGLGAQHRNVVDAGDVELFGAQEVEYDGEVFGIAIDENETVLVTTTRYATAQKRREERVGHGAQRLTRRREFRSAHVQIDYIARERLL